jgi:hypothetical protein
VSVQFLSPFAAFIAVLGVVPALALVAARRRARLVRGRLGLTEPAPRSLVPAFVAVCAAASLVGLAAAQPVIDRSKQRYVRSDAEALFVLDTSRSMLAQPGPSGVDRLARAKRAAAELRATIPDVPVGLASITDRTLPYLLPTADEDAFAATLAHAADIEQPPPMLRYSTRVTTLAALAGVATENFYSPSAKRRLLVVFTDGESRPFDSALIGGVFRRPPGIETVFVRFWGMGERIYSNGTLEAAYRPDPRTGQAVQQLAAATGGRAFSEGQLAEAAGAIRAYLGTGPKAPIGRQPARLVIAPYFLAAVLVPLALLLRRRDV